MTDGARTHDNRNHNPGLYRLSYSHHRKDKLQDNTARINQLRFTCLHVLPERAAAAKNSILANFRSLGKADITTRLTDRILAIITERANRPAARRWARRWAVRWAVSWARDWTRYWTRSWGLY